MLYCKRVVDSVSDASYYLLVSMHSSDGEVEHSTAFDVQVTDGESAWSQSGLRRPNTQIADWMATAKQALTQNSDKFTFIITPKKKPDVLRLRWEYYKEMKDFEGRLAGQIDVEHASSPSEVVQNILGTALDNLSSLQASQKQVQQQCDLFKKEAETAQRQVQDYVQQKQKREAELYVKLSLMRRKPRQWNGSSRLNRHKRLYRKHPLRGWLTKAPLRGTWVTLTVKALTPQMMRSRRWG